MNESTCDLQWRFFMISLARKRRNEVRKKKTFFIRRNPINYNLLQTRNNKKTESTKNCLMKEKKNKKISLKPNEDVKRRGWNRFKQSVCIVFKVFHFHFNRSFFSISHFFCNEQTHLAVSRARGEKRTKKKTFQIYSNFFSVSLEAQQSAV